MIAVLIMLCSCAGAPGGNPGDDPVVSTAAASRGTEGTDDGNVNPYEKYIGVWSTDEDKTNQILIWEITEATVKFNGGVSGFFGFDATAMSLDGEFVFGDGISPAYSGPDGVKGRLSFSDDCITVIYESFGTLENPEFYPTEYKFTIREANSEEIISQYKASQGN